MNVKTYSSNTQNSYYQVVLTFHKTHARAVDYLYDLYSMTDIMVAQWLKSKNYRRFQRLKTTVFWIERRSYCLCNMSVAAAKLNIAEQIDFWDGEKTLYIGSRTIKKKIPPDWPKKPGKPQEKTRETQGKS